jgi:hypothetical protein
MKQVEYARAHRKPRQKDASPSNISTTDGESYDSPLTFHGTPRKRKYTANRKRRALKRYSTKKNNRRATYIKDCQIKLMSFAPMYTTIYTMAHGRGDWNKYLYVDVLALHDNRLYKITKLVSAIMDYPLLQSKSNFRMPDVVRIPYGGTNEDTQEKRYIELEEKLVKDLSMKIFGYDGGYFWQSMHKLYAYDVEKQADAKEFRIRQAKPIENNNEKSFIVKKRNV